MALVADKFFACFAVAIITQGDMIACCFHDNVFDLAFDLHERYRHYLTRFAPTKVDTILMFDYDLFADDKLPCN